MIKTISMAAAMISMSFIAAPLHAATVDWKILHQQGDNGFTGSTSVGNNMVLTDLVENQFIFDDVVLGENTGVDVISWVGRYSNTYFTVDTPDGIRRPNDVAGANAASIPGDPTLDSNFVLNVYDHGSGQPGALKHSLTNLNISREAFGDPEYNLFTYTAYLDQAIEFSAHSWVSIFNNVLEDGVHWRWALSVLAGPNDPGSIGYYFEYDGLPDVNGTPQFARTGTGDGSEFMLTLGTANVNAVPIPATLPLLFSALTGLGIIGYRKKQKA